MELRITTLIASGDHKEALDVLACAYGSACGRFCATLVGSEADAEELVQEALIEAYRAMPRYRGAATVKSWFFGISRRICIQHLRRRDRRRSLLTRWFYPGAEEAHTPPDPAEQSEARRALAQALGRLKPKLRDAVLLRYQAGLDHREVAQALHISPAAARKRTSLGISALRAELGPWLMNTKTQPHAGEEDHERLPATLDARILHS